jgi:predicted dehydrogenase
MNIGIIGCGLIGNKRAQEVGNHMIRWLVDTDLAKAETLAKFFPSARSSVNWRNVIEDNDVDAVFVATTHNFLAPITLAAVEAGKHVLVEKPAATNVRELDPIIEKAEDKGVCVKVGFNHRYHSAFIKAKEIVHSGELGPLMFIRARYGHGARIGYEKEWRASPELSGGGELIDQGIHLIDLSRWFLGDFQEVYGFTTTYYWDMPVEDNAFLMLKTANKKVAWLHASWTEWKNLFSFEIYGEKGKLHIEGLGGSYGMERLAWYKMLPQMGPPATIIWEYPFRDRSWRLEFEEFLNAIAQKRVPSGNLCDARAALEIVQKVYGGSK